MERKDKVLVKVESKDHLWKEEGLKPQDNFVLVKH